MNQEQKIMLTYLNTFMLNLKKNPEGILGWFFVPERILRRKFHGGFKKLPWRENSSSGYLTFKADIHREVKLFDIAFALMSYTW